MNLLLFYKITTMSFFKNKFLQGKVSRRNLVSFQRSDRKSEDDSCFGSTVTLHLGDLTTAFDNGHWNSKLRPLSETNMENVSLKKTINKLKEENNLLKLKNEILLDMLAEESLSKATKPLLPWKSRPEGQKILLENSKKT